MQGFPRDGASGEAIGCRYRDLNMQAPTPPFVRSDRIGQQTHTRGFRSKISELDLDKNPLLVDCDGIALDAVGQGFCSDLRAINANSRRLRIED